MSLLKKYSLALESFESVIGEAFRTGTVFAEKETILNRIKICEGCPEIRNPDSVINFRCKICDCQMHGKARLKAVRCPIGKW